MPERRNKKARQSRSIVDRIQETQKRRSLTMPRNNVHSAEYVRSQNCCRIARILVVVQIVSHPSTLTHTYRWTLGCLMTGSRVQYTERASTHAAHIYTIYVYMYSHRRTIGVLVGHCRLARIGTFVAASVYLESRFTQLFELSNNRRFCRWHWGTSILCHLRVRTRIIGGCAMTLTIVVFFSELLRHILARSASTIRHENNGERVREISVERLANATLANAPGQTRGMLLDWFSRTRARYIVYIYI